ncbi:MAG TPA: guanylate kinase [Candidatus Omnitrophica bacterium]|nr:guanylate kinase [Candidatus Omnitrophota bacterium]
MKFKNRLFIISGPSGVGKTTISHLLLKSVPKLQKTISCTTRERRPGEVEGKDYYFISRKEFQSLIAKDAFLEWAKVLNDFYGTLKKEVITIMRSGKDALLCIDVQGAEQVKSKIPSACTIFILPPSYSELKNRMEKRNEKKEVISRRLKLAIREIKKVYNYDYYVINDELNKAVKLIKYIIYAQRAKVERKIVKEVLKDVLCEL